MKFPKKILLIDHEPGVTRLIRRALERAGKYLIREEHDDKLALNAARWFQPDLILVDTPDQDRRNIERQIHTDAALKDTPVLSLSSLRPESQMVSGGILSGYSFFAAPIRVEEVLLGVDELRLLRFELNLTDLLSVRGRVFQLFEIVRIVDLEDEDPTLAEWLSVDQPWVGFERLVYFDHSPFDRRVDIARGFD